MPIELHERPARGDFINQLKIDYKDAKGNPEPRLGASG